MTGMRELSIDELDHVAGGYYSGDVVVVARVGASRFSFSGGYASGNGGRDPNGFYPDVTAEDYSPGTGTGLTDADVDQIITDVIGELAGKAFDYFSGKEAQRHEREVALSRGFDPDDVAKEVAHLGNGPELYYLMKDGSTFIDRDGNGMVDEHVKYSGDGAIFIDKGDGFVRVNP